METDTCDQEWASSDASTVLMNDIRDKMKSFWKRSYADHFKCMDPSEHENLFFKMKSDMTRIYSKRSDYTSSRKLIEQLIERELQAIKHSPENYGSEQVATQQNESRLIENMNKLKLNPGGQMNDQDLIKEKLKERMLEMAKLYPTNLIRAHSKDSGSLHDCSTPVTDAAFELADRTSTSSLHTNIVATCGLNIVNFIDTETGKVVKRFNDEMTIRGNQDSFTRLAWTRLDETSVLVAGGSHGQIKVIVPKISTCVARIDSHDSPISSIIFHPKYSDIVLTGSNDHKVKIWRLKLKEGPTDIEWECGSELIGTVEYLSIKGAENVMSMCFAGENILLVATSHANYYIELDDKKLFKKVSKEGKQSNGILKTTNYSNDEAIQFMTVDSQKDDKSFQAIRFFIRHRTEDGKEQEEDVRCNTFQWAQDTIFASLANSELVYNLRPIRDEHDGSLVFKRVLFNRMGMQKIQTENQLSVYEEHGFVLGFRGTSDGLFFIYLDLINGFRSILKLNLPTEYSVKYVNETTSASIKDYGLLPKGNVLKVITNSQAIVAVTNQNIISIWKRSA